MTTKTQITNQSSQEKDDIFMEKTHQNDKKKKDWREQKLTPCAHGELWGYEKGNQEEREEEKQERH